MTEIDPYQTLGVPRQASRAEIARAYRLLAKRHHPDAGAPASRAMTRINEAWHVLSDPGRRAAWDRRHTVVEPAPWRPAYAPAEPIRRPPPTPPVERSIWDSGWLALAVVLGIGLLVAVIMAGISTAANPDTRAQFSSDAMEFAYPNDWVLAEGTDGDPAHRVLAHLVTFPVEAQELCTAFGADCGIAGRVPAGEASVIITAWEGGTPPEPEPVVSRPFGLDADAVIGGEAAVYEYRSTGDGAVAWWQLSPPGFPDRWIEVTADLGGQQPDMEGVLGDIWAMLDTVEFSD